MVLPNFCILRLLVDMGLDKTFLTGAILGVIKKYEMRIQDRWNKRQRDYLYHDDLYFYREAYDNDFEEEQAGIDNDALQLGEKKFVGMKVVYANHLVDGSIHNPFPNIHPFHNPNNPNNPNSQTGL